MSSEREVQQVLARYVRAADKRDGKAMSSLFVEEAHVEIYEGQQKPQQIGLIEGAGAIGADVARLMKPPIEDVTEAQFDDGQSVEVAGGYAV
jgi:hypothetical protein